MRASGNGFFFIGILLLILAVVIIAFTVALSLPVELAYFAAGFILLGGPATGLGYFLRNKTKIEKEIQATGIEGQATLTSWGIMHKSGGELEAVELIEYDLDVTVGGNPPYRVVHRQLTPFDIYNRMNKGMVLLVKVHREKPEIVLLDWRRGVGQAQSPEDIANLIGEALKGVQPKTSEGNLNSRLKSLEEAYREGLTTAEEYERKRAEILKRM